MSQIVALPDGRKAEFPDGMPKEKIEAVIAKQFPRKHPWEKATESARKGELPDGQKLAEATKRALKVMVGMEKPKDADEAILLMLGTSPMFLAGGAGAAALATKMGAPAAIVKLAPSLGRMITAGGFAKARGESNAEAALDVAGAGVAEGAMGAASKVLGGPAKAIDAIKARIGKGPDGPVNLKMLEKMLAWWKADGDHAVQGARAAKIGKTLNELDAEGVAGKIFREEVAKGAKLPLKTLPPVPLAASQGARAATSSPAARSVADAALGTPPASALAVGALPKLATAAHVPGAKHVVDAIEEAE